MDYLGAHMSISGGLSKAIDRGSAAGCGVIQIFTQNSNQWRGKAVSDSDVSLFREKREAAGLVDIVSHDIYLINLAAAPGEVRDKSLVGFLEEMERCARLGIDKIVMHPGSHVGEGEETGIKRIVEAFDHLLDEGKDFTGKVLLETTAGQGTNIGYRFEHLGEIRDRSAFPDRFAFCFDTCHTFAAGYDFTTAEGYRQVFADFDRILGLENLLAFFEEGKKLGIYPID